MHDSASLDALVSRRVDYRYRRHGFAFDLSQALFSSAAVDGGTHLLLATVADELEVDSYDRFVDVGCGVGTLGIALAGSASRPLVAVDRDALAVAFTRRNAATNGVDSLSAKLALTVPEYPGEGRELVASNIPAKAGEPVLRMLIDQIGRRASLSGGHAAVVIVRPLADLLDSELSSIGATIVAERRTANHAAVIFSCQVPPQDPAPDAPLPEQFVRDAVEFPGPSRPYRIDTVYNLPDFDRLSFRTALAFDLLRGTELAGPVLLYGCGQGHLLAGLSQRAGRSAALQIADRDLLALEIASRNAAALGVRLDRAAAVPTIASLVAQAEAGSLGWLVIDDDPTPGSRWNRDIADAASRLLTATGKLLIVSRSTSVGRFQREAGPAYAQIAERRMHGFRAAALRPRR